MESLRIDLIRRTIPTLMAEELTSVQPMSGDMLPAVLKLFKEYTPREYTQGERVHDFALGWLRYYGTEFISEDLWIRLKIKRL